MGGFEDDLYDEEQPRLHGMYIGEVVDRDPKLKRVTVKIDGLMEPKSDWAYPIGGMAGGSKNVGSCGVPRQGASVCVWFANGDPERPFYMPANWGEDEIPEEVADKQDATIWSSENWLILMDDTAGERKLRIVNRKNGSQEFIEFDAEDNSISINGTTAISISSLGQIDISGAVVTINGRKVLPNSEPI